MSLIEINETSNTISGCLVERKCRLHDGIKRVEGGA